MTSKHLVAADSTGLSSLSCFATQLSFDSPLLASIIPLPENPLISYAVWSPASPVPVSHSDSLNLIEQARKRIVQCQSSSSALESLLPSLHISGTSIALYVFAISSANESSALQTTLTDLEFDGLSASLPSSFTPADLYPCSDICSGQTIPCPTCLNHSSSRQPSTSARLLPRRSLRRPLVQFLNSIREHLIHCVTRISRQDIESAGSVTLRLRNGFLFGSICSQSEWRSGWDRFAQEYPLTYCELSVHLSQSSQTSAHLLVRPRLSVSYYHPLLPLLPTPSGTPLVLLPHGAPAYFLSIYTGPTVALTSHFNDALLGFGAGDWKAMPSLPTSSADPVFIIAWLSVQHKPEEEKGMLIVWPANLCVAFIPGASSAHAQSTLDNIPTLPTQLQSSPPTEARIPLSILSMGRATDTDAISLDTLAPSVLPASPHSAPPPPPSSPMLPHSTPRPSLHRSPASYTLQAFKSLTLQHASQALDATASDVSDFVVAVAREREKERERIKREKQGVVSSSSSPEKPVVPPTPSHPDPIATDIPLRSNIVTTIPIPPESNVPSYGDEIVIPEIESSRTPGSLFSDDEDDDINPASSIPIQPGDGETPNLTAHTNSTPEHPLSSSPPNASENAMNSGVDPFSAFDSAWPQSNGDFGDYSMDFQLSAGNGILGLTDDIMDDGFGVFTEDDFSFFDGPNVTTSDIIALPSSAHPSNHDRNLNSEFGLSVSTRSPANDGNLSSGFGPLSAQSQPSPWVAIHGGDTSTPQMDTSHLESDTSLTLPQRPKWLLNDPQSPPVHLHDPSRAPSSPGYGQPGRRRSVFDAIPFDTMHRIADGKYALGKFALPSPPQEDDCYERPSFNGTGSSASSTDWKARYSNVTDPRVGVRRQLAGMKRRHSTQGGRPSKSMRDWEEGPQDEWRNLEDKPDSDEEENWMSEDVPSPAPKAATPPPPYLPLGPTLLQTHFHFPFLHPISVALGPSHTTQDTSPSPTAISAPTPVSPAAILGSSSEKTKSLEAAGQILLREAVENPVWAEAWRAVAAARSSKLATRDIWPIDLKRTANLFDAIEATPLPVVLKSLVRPDNAGVGGGMHPLESPLLSVAKAGEVMHILPPALRFWEKLGLSPRGGEKDVTVYFFVDQANEHRETEAVNLLSRLSTVYSAKHYGQHVTGQAPGCTHDGIVPTRYESFRKALSSFVSGLPRTPSGIVIYILTPDIILQWASPIMRQVLSAIKRINKTQQTSSPILFQFIPECFLTTAGASAQSSHSLTESFIDSVYDRIPCPVRRNVVARYSTSSTDPLIFQQIPSFTLARPSHVKVKFTKDESMSALGVVDRNTMLHIGYQVTQSGKWLLASFVDQRGEAHDLKAWLMPDENHDAFIVDSIWSFAFSFAEKASVEWHLVIAKRGSMLSHEIDAWCQQLRTTLCADDSPPISVSIVCVEQNNPWYFLPERKDGESWSPPSTRGPKSIGSIALNVSSTSFALHSMTTTPIPSASHAGFSVDRPAEPLDSESDEAICRAELGLLPFATSSLVHIPSGKDHTCISMLNLHFLHYLQSRQSCASRTDPMIQEDVSRNFHELSELAKARWKTAGSYNLPLHLAALEVMRTTLDESDGNDFVE